MLEARNNPDGSPLHPPGVFQTANDYGEETTELETACRIMGSSCSYALQSTILNRKALLEKLKSTK